MNDNLRVKKEQLHNIRNRRKIKNRIFSLSIIIILIASLWLRSLIEKQEQAISESFEAVYWILFIIERINFILILLLFMLISREIIVLVMEWYQNKAGSKYKAKIVLIFIILAIVPSGFTIYVSSRLLKFSIDRWFDIDISQNIEYSQNLADEYLNLKKNALKDATHDIINILEVDLKNNKALKNNINNILKTYQDSIKGIMIIENNDQIVSRIDSNFVLDHIKSNILTDNFSIQNFSEVQIFSNDHTYLLHLMALSEYSEILILTYTYIDADITSYLDNIYRSASRFEQQTVLQSSIENYYFYSLLLISILIVFMAIWFGLHFSNEITVPIISLIEGTKKLAKGDFDIEIEKHSAQEIGILIDSFNAMVHDIKQNRDNIEKANRSLEEKTNELQSKTYFIELLIQNISAGIIAISIDYKIITVNKTFCNLFDLDEDEILKRPAEEIFSNDYKPLMNIIKDTAQLNKNEIYQNLSVNIKNTYKTLRVISQFLSVGISENKHILLMVEDISDIIRAEKLTAWKEVAKRIAHEIKNPLTPLQLSIQRICRTIQKEKELSNYQDFFDENRFILEESIKTIKLLVNEFHRFAKLPSINPQKDDINSLLSELYTFYNNQEPNIAFHLNLQKNLPPIMLDREMMKRAIMNLINNAIDAVNYQGCIVIASLFDKDLDCVCIEIRDNGPGLTKEQKENLFMPYYSTKKHKSGTGLGLSIVLSIVSDHKAYIRILDNKPAGCIFRIEFPYIKE